MVGLIAVSLLTLVAVFQFALALGLQQGDMVYGGMYPKSLPARMRYASVLAGIMLLVIASFFAMKAGFIYPVFKGAVLNTIIGVITGLLFLNTLGNIVSRSAKERYIMSPISLTIVICGILLLVNW